MTPDVTLVNGRSAEDARALHRLDDDATWAATAASCGRVEVASWVNVHRDGRP